jgi:glycogen debranching enzyme
MRMSERYGPLAAAARATLEANRQRGTSSWDGKAYDYVCPSRSDYPYQWLWDSAFHAICLLHADPELAKQEIRCLLQGAQPDGSVPHMLLWRPGSDQEAAQRYNIALAGPHFTATTQPPVIGRAIARVYEATRDAAFAAEMLPSTLRLFDWLAETRDPDRDGLVSILQPDESGLDASPKYDLPLGLSGRDSLVKSELNAVMHHLFEVYAPHRAEPAKLFEDDFFQVEDVMFNSIYADGLRALARVLRAVPVQGWTPEELEARASKVTAALMAKCWDEQAGVFWDLSGAGEQHLSVLTFTSLFPLILEDLDAAVAKRLVEDHLLDPAEFWTRYPIPSVACDEPGFDPAFRSQAVWRGPTWVNVNWYLYWGLKAHGYDEIASELANRTFEMVLRGGQREFFNPLTAEGLGATDFSWTSLVLDLLAAENKLPR